MCTIYKNIERLCRINNITGGKMCADLNLSRSILTGLKNGKKKTINSATANKIANYFNVSVDEILLPHIEPDIVTLFTGSGEYAPPRPAANLTQRLPEQTKKPTPEGERSVSDDDIKFALFGGDGEITDAMYDEVKRFARMVKLREEAEKKKE